MGVAGDKYWGEERLVGKTYRTEIIRRRACVWKKTPKHS